MQRSKNETMFKRVSIATVAHRILTAKQLYMLGQADTFSDIAVLRSAIKHNHRIYIIEAMEDGLTVYMCTVFVRTRSDKRII